MTPTEAVEYAPLDRQGPGGSELVKEHAALPRCAEGRLGVLTEKPGLTWRRHRRVGRSCVSRLPTSARRSLYWTGFNLP